MNRKLAGILLVSALTLLVAGCGITKTNPGDSDRPSLTDNDRDNIPDVKDVDLDNDLIPNINDADMDGDGKQNTSDNDIDGDGISNIDDNDIDGDGITNINDPDMDGDGKLNTSDDDIDGDGIININDNDIDGDGISNNVDTDIDGDDFENSIDTDLDGDGISNDNDVDIDGDGIENNADTDIDNDGLTNDLDPIDGGTTNNTNGTQGDSNQGGDINDGAINSGDDQNGGFTDDDLDEEGIIVAAVDSLSYLYNITGGSAGDTKVETETINLAEVREAINRNQIALSTVSVVNLQVTTDTEGAAFIAANSTKHVAINLYYLDQNNNPIKVLGTPAQAGLAGPILTFADLSDGLDLSEEIFGSPEGYTNFIAMIKDESQSTITTQIELVLLDDLAQGGTLPLTFKIMTEGMRNF